MSSTRADCSWRTQSTQWKIMTWRRAWPSKLTVTRCSTKDPRSNQSPHKFHSHSTRAWNRAVESSDSEKALLKTAVHSTHWSHQLRILNHQPRLSFSSRTLWQMTNLAPISSCQSGSTSQARRTQHRPTLIKRSQPTFCPKSRIGPMDESKAL